MTRFAKVPEELISDKRLTERQLRVMLALLLHADKSGRCNPKRETISALCGIALPHVSVATKDLCELGLLKKTGNGGYSRAAEYQITVTESVQVNMPNTSTISVQELPVPNRYSRTKSVTVTKSVRGMRRTKSVRGKEQTNEQTNNKCEKTKNGSISYNSLPDGISLDAAKNFVAFRKLKKSPLTQRAFDQAMTHASQAHTIGLTPDAALDETVAAGWSGVNLAWLAKRLDRQPKQKRHSEIEHERAVMREWQEEMEMLANRRKTDG